MNKTPKTRINTLAQELHERVIICEAGALLRDELHLIDFQVALPLCHRAVEGPC
jgi:hypothetical protein